MNVSIHQSLERCPIPNSILEQIQLTESTAFDVSVHATKALKLSPTSVRFQYGWIEIVFFYCTNPLRWRFMGSSVNIQTARGPEELASSIFRADPKEEILCPWEAVFVFCETTLQSHCGRIFPPFVRMVSGADRSRDLFYPLTSFNYQTMRWNPSIPSLSKPDKRLE